MKFATKGLLVMPAALLLCAVANATPSQDVADATASARLQVSDLNLATNGGQRKLERRTDAAISEVCPSRGSAAGPRAATNAAHRKCAEAVRASVRAQVDDLGARTVATRN